jgi:septum formation protein
MQIYLASSSPRRRDLLAFMGWNFTVVPARVDETAVPGESPQAYVSRLAEAKAKEVGEFVVSAKINGDQLSVSSLDPQAIVISADTTVVDGDKILGKPVDASQAAEILRRLRGRTHQVMTALALLVLPEAIMYHETCVSSVTMRDFSEDEMQAYIASGDAYDKAGAYAIQHAGFSPAASYQGCYTNVMGLPLCRVVRLFKEVGYPTLPLRSFSCLTESRNSCAIGPEVFAC